MSAALLGLRTDLTSEIDRLRAENANLKTERDRACQERNALDQQLTDAINAGTAILDALTPIATILSRVTPADNERNVFARFFAVVRARGMEEERQKHQEAFEKWEAGR